MALKFISSLPPAARGPRKSTNTAELVSELKTRPDTWAQVKTFKTQAQAASAAAYLASGKASAAPRGRVSTATRKLSNGEFALFARFNTTLVMPQSRRTRATKKRAA